MESSGLRQLLLLICFFLGAQLNSALYPRRYGGGYCCHPIRPPVACLRFKPLVPGVNSCQLARLRYCGDQTVRGIVGGSVTLKVNTSGLQEDSAVLWTWGPVSQETVIAESFNGDSSTDFLEKFRSRLQLDRATGSLTITDLDVNDSGLYQVQVVGGDKFQSRFILTVYGPVSKPEVRKTPAGRALVTQNCSLLCSVQNGREVTLSCYRKVEEKPLSNTSSPDLNSTLTLPLETEGQYNTYSCVASNPVSRQTTTVNTSERCRNRDNKNSSNSDQSRRYAVPAVCSVVGVLAVIGAVAYLKRHRDKQREELGSGEHTGSKLLTVRRNSAEEQRPLLAESVTASFILTRSSSLHPWQCECGDCAWDRAEEPLQISSHGRVDLFTWSNSDPLWLNWVSAGLENPRHRSTSVFIPPVIYNYIQAFHKSSII